MLLVCILSSFLHFCVVQFKLGLLVCILYVFTFLCSTILTWIIGVYFIIFLYFYFVLHDDKNYLDLININKKSLIVITNNYDTKKENCPNIIKIIPIIYIYYYYYCLVSI